jgi:uncharacterized protein
MILEFTIGNFLSFKDKRTLNLESSSITEYENNIAEYCDHKILKSAVIYGANSSGKSNLIKAMSTMRRLLTHSSKQSSTDKLNVVPFLLNTETENSPSYFEVLFLLDDGRYRYGFEVDNSSIASEWLFKQPKNKEVSLFIRDRDKIEVSKEFIEAANLEEKTRENGLFLSVVDQFNGPTAKKIMKWFHNWVTISGLRHEDYRGITLSMLERDLSKDQLKEFYRSLDLGFQELNLIVGALTPERLAIKNVPNEVLSKIISDLKGGKVATIETLHRRFDPEGSFVDFRRFDLDQQESAGTNKIVDISGAIFKTLGEGSILVIDELDAKLHPLLTIAIIRLFNSPEINKKNAQLIFATHDTNLLGCGCFRRDQIYFTEKDKFEATDLYSLVEYKEDDGTKVRKDRSFEKDYIAGRYGAIPFIGDINILV